MNDRSLHRPEWIHCIADKHQDRIGLSLCGRTIGWPKIVPVPPGDPFLRLDPNATMKVLKPTEFVFVSIGHWWSNAKVEGRLAGCPGCRQKIQETLDYENTIYTEE